MSFLGKHHYRCEYLKSEHWKQLRLEKLNSRNCECAKCGFKSASNDVHHLDYKQLYDVELLDLVVLCRGCHILLHSKMDEWSAQMKTLKHPRPCYVDFIQFWNTEKPKLPEILRAIQTFRKKYFPKGTKSKTPVSLTGRVDRRISFSRKEFIAFTDYAKRVGIDFPELIRKSLWRNIFDPPPDSFFTKPHALT